MSKLVRLNKKYWPRDDYGYWCPGCKTGHEIAVENANYSGARWSFDGNFTSPTFSPSINYRVNTPDMQGYQSHLKSSICHHFVRDGKIQFLGDCTHELRGQTVDLPDIPSSWYISCERL